MDAELWKKVESLYQAALAQPPILRTPFLARACPDDPLLRAEVQSLLDQKADSFLESSPLSAPPLLAPGRKLGKFEIVALLGRGGMGEVWRARDSQLKRQVAIKTLPSLLANDRDRISRFEREARAASALNHPNIVTVHDVFSEDGVPFIVSELVEGETLAQVIQSGPLPIRKLIEVASQICDGLATAHAAGIIHRDLKPGNIMLTSDGRVKILDFGLARQAQPLEPEGTTVDISRSDAILGTPGYMSPEQVRNEPADARSDLFSIGVILYEMASGKRAFSGTSSIEVMNSILKDDPPELPPTLPPGLNRIMRRCLEKNRTRRFQTAADLGFALQSLSLAPARAERPRRRAWWKWAALGAIGLMTGFVYWLAIRPPPTPAPHRLALRRLTSGKSLVRDAAISPDGKLVAYSLYHAGPASRGIWLQQLDGGGDAIRILSDSAEAYDPVFSTDGTQIAFRSERGNGGIYVIPALGGEVRELVPEGRLPKFSPDGRWLMYSISEGNQPLKFFVRPLSGGPDLQVGAETREICNAVWSPDGSRIFLQADCDRDVETAWVYSLDTKTMDPNRDVTVIWDSSIAQWIGNPPRLIVWKGVGDAYVATAVPVSADGTKVAGPPERLASVTDQLFRVSAALDGRMVLSVSTSKAHVWGLPIDAQGRAAGEPKQLTDGPEDEKAPALSRDGGKLTFTSLQANRDRIFYKDLQTGKERQLSRNEAHYNIGAVFNPDGTGILCGPDHFLEYLPLSGGLSRRVWDRANPPVWDWSPDGKTVLIDGYERWGTAGQLDLESGLVTAFLDDPDLNTWQAHFSSDGRWVTFNANPSDNKTSRVFVAPSRKGLVSRSEWIPVTHGDWDDKPRFSSDGKWIFFVTGHGSQPHRFWKQALRSDMRPEGNPVAVYSPQESRRVMTDDDISVGPRLIVFTQTVLSGNIWVLEPERPAPK